jgi:hypothetical protein
MEPVTDSFQAMKWLFWNLGPSLNGLHDQLTTIPGRPREEKIMAICVASLHYNGVISWSTLVLHSFIRPSFCACLFEFVTREPFSVCPYWKLHVNLIWRMHLCCSLEDQILECPCKSCRIDSCHVSFSLVWFSESQLRRLLSNLS